MLKDKLVALHEQIAAFHQLVDHMADHNILEIMMFFVVNNFIMIILCPPPMYCAHQCRTRSANVVTAQSPCPVRPEQPRGLPRAAQLG